MRLSFVIPAYNEEAFIGQCLESILQQVQQSNHDVEIIVVNNASIDHTATIARSFSGVKVVDEPKKGLSQARQTGYIIATGDLIANVDADTMLTPGWIERVFYEFERDPQLVALTGPVVYYDLPRYTRILVKIFYWIAYLVYLNNQLWKIGSFIQGGNFVLKQSVLKDLGGYNTDLTFYGEDADVARRLVGLGTVKFTFRFPIFTSGRRLVAEGIATMGLKYAINYFWIMFFKKPFTTQAQDIRPKQ